MCSINDNQEYLKHDGGIIVFYAVKDILQSSGSCFLHLSELSEELVVIKALSVSVLYFSISVRGRNNAYHTMHISNSHSYSFSQLITTKIWCFQREWSTGANPPNSIITHLLHIVLSRYQHFNPFWLPSQQDNAFTHNVRALINWNESHFTLLCFVWK